MRVNSVIFKDSEDGHLIDFTYLGTMLKENFSIQIYQEGHFFFSGDVLAYSFEKGEFVRAIARNTMQSEICGVVSEIIDINNFILVTKGTVQAPQYKYPDGSTLYLSEVIPGKLNSIFPTKTFREVATQISTGIIEVNLKFGTTMGSFKPDSPPGHYTKDELDEIIANLM